MGWTVLFSGECIAVSPFRGASKMGVYLFRNVLLLFWIKLRENKTCMTCFSATRLGSSDVAGMHVEAVMPRPMPSSPAELVHSTTRYVMTSLVPITDASHRPFP